MKLLLRLLCLLTVLVLLPMGCLADAALRGYTKAGKYQYVTFGNYPQSAEGEVSPVLWRVLTVNEPQGTVLLLTDLVMDAYPIIWVDNKKDADNHNFRRITTFEESDMYVWLRETMAATMFTEQELSVLNDERGPVFMLTASEYLRVDYGFTKSVYGAQISRVADATPYALSRGCYEEKGRTLGATYWVNDIRSAQGYHMRIVGVNGHMSWGGYGRKNIGIRPAVLVKTELVDIVSGAGTAEDPYVLSVK